VPHHTDAIRLDRLTGASLITFRGGTTAKCLQSDRTQGEDCFSRYLVKWIHPTGVFMSGLYYSNGIRNGCGAYSQDESDIISYTSDTAEPLRHTEYDAESDLERIEAYHNNQRMRAKVLAKQQGWNIVPRCEQSAMREMFAENVAAQHVMRSAGMDTPLTKDEFIDICKDGLAKKPNPERFTILNRCERLFMKNLSNHEREFVYNIRVKNSLSTAQDEWLNVLCVKYGTITKEEFQSQFITA